MDEEKLIILVQGHVCLYNLQHNDYDNNVVKYNCWKEIAGKWHGGGRIVASSRQGNGMVCVNRSLTRQGKGRGTAGERHGNGMGDERDLNHNTEMASRQLHWELLEELKCPVCLMYIAPPINMCENGHNVCSSCKERLVRCPTCRGNFVNVRNVTLEKLAASAIYPCKNRETGCEETFTADNRDIHLAECSFQSRDCPFKKISGVDCPWTGTLSDIPDHITREHNSETAEVPAHFVVDLLDFVERSRYRKVVFCLGELFYLTWEREGDILSFGVFHFGPKNETEDFKYGIKVGNSEYCVSVTRKCHSYFDGDLKKLHHRDCVTLYHNTLLYCLNAGGYLPCEIEIGREELDGFVSNELREFLQVFVAIGSDIGIGRNMSDTPLPPRQSPPPPPTPTARLLSVLSPISSFLLDPSIESQFR